MAYNSKATMGKMSSGINTAQRRADLNKRQNRHAAKHHAKTIKGQESVEKLSASISELKNENISTKQQKHDLADKVSKLRRPAAEKMVSKISHMLKSQVEPNKKIVRILGTGTLENCQNQLEAIATKMQDKAYEVTHSDIELLDMVRNHVVDAMERHNPENPSMIALKEGSNLHLNNDAINAMKEDLSADLIQKPEKTQPVLDQEELDMLNELEQSKQENLAETMAHFQKEGVKFRIKDEAISELFQQDQPEALVETALAEDTLEVESTAEAEIQHEITDPADLEAIIQENLKHVIDPEFRASLEQAQQGLKETAEILDRTSTKAEQPSVQAKKEPNKRSENLKGKLHYITKEMLPSLALSVTAQKDQLFNKLSSHIEARKAEQVRQEMLARGEQEFFTEVENTINERVGDYELNMPEDRELVMLEEATSNEGVGFTIEHEEEIKLSEEGMHIQHEESIEYTQPSPIDTYESVATTQETSATFSEEKPKKSLFQSLKEKVMNSSIVQKLVNKAEEKAFISATGHVLKQELETPKTVAYGDDFDLPENQIHMQVEQQELPKLHESLSHAVAREGLHVAQEIEYTTGAYDQIDQPIDMDDFDAPTSTQEIQEGLALATVHQLKDARDARDQERIANMAEAQLEAIQMNERVTEIEARLAEIKNIKEDIFSDEIMVPEMKDKLITQLNEEFEALEAEEAELCDERIEHENPMDELGLSLHR